MMKKSHLLVISVACLSLLTGCEKFICPSAGDDIFFTGSTNTSQVSGCSTKVIYDRVDNPEEGGTAPISWANGDKVTINCPEARAVDPENVKQADYMVTSIDGKSARLALDSPRNPIGLRWNDDESVMHHFYAVYPSVYSNGVVETFDSKTITCEIPFDQTPPEGSLTDDGNGNYVLAPDMKWMLMHAEASYRRADFPRDGAVFLKFQPLTTAIQFTIENGGETDAVIMGISLTPVVDELHPQQLWGKFIIEDVTNIDEKGFPIITTGETKQMMAVPSMSFANPIVLKVGKSLEFTFLFPPLYDITSLSLQLELAIKGTMSTKLGFTDGTYLTFPKLKKSFVKGIVVPETKQLTIDYSMHISSWVPTSSKFLDF